MPRSGIRATNPRWIVVWAAIAAVLAVALGWALYLARHVLLLIYVSALFAIGLSPLVRWLERRRVVPFRSGRLPHWGAALAVYVGILALAVGLGLLVVPAFVGQAREFAAQVPTLFGRLQDYLVAKGLLREPMTFGEVLQSIPAARGADAVGTAVGAAWGVAGGIVGVVTIVVLSLYLVIEAEQTLGTFVRLFPRERRPAVDAVARKITFRVSAWLRGQVLLGGIIGVTAAVGLGLLGIPFFYVLAVIAAVGEMIPVIGPILAAIPGIALAFSESGTKALWTAGFYLAQQQLENHVLVPKLMERQVGLSAVAVVVALLIGSALLGIVGALLAVPTAAIVQVLFTELVLRDEE
jgi:predicted PurR-regulated permease PerM